MYLWILPSKYDAECKNRIYTDLIKIAEESKKSVVGIIPESYSDDLISHNGIGSGVIFEKNSNTYYVITAAHVIENKNSMYKIFTINTEFSGQIVNADENVKFEILDDNYYNSLLNAKIEYISDTADLAILSFETDEQLPIMKFKSSKIKKGDRIIAIGHPNGNRYQVTYGTITSDVKSVDVFTKTTGEKKSDKIIEHNAYLNFGNSGGALISENMEMAGINIGGEFNKLGYFSKGYMVPYDIIEENIKDWRDKQ